jgi:hypothetical protein
VGKDSNVNRRERRRWQKNVLHFARACGGAAESFIIPAAARTKISLAALCGEPTGIALAKAIAIWTEQAMRPGARTLCLDCDTVFGPEIQPAAYAVSLPFANRDVAITTGVCANCIAPDAELQRKVLQRLRSIFPDAYCVNGAGHG